ncbi:MAG TPA: S8 family serine peptidase [Thermoanaerobaculia bacterium]|nr:S8 family serine peptidase [Thermoanaerobaculia bacterium]
MFLSRGVGGQELVPSPQIAPTVSAQVDALQRIKEDRSGVERKIDSRLFLGLLHQRRDSRVEALTSFRFIRPDSDGRVAVDVILQSASGLKAVASSIEELGGVVSTKSAASRTLRARVKLDDLETLAGSASIKRVRAAVPAFTQAINVSEGDLTHGAAEARGFFGVDGSGVKVGVLSDGVDSLAALEASGDLPPGVQVLAGQAGSGNEGAAMLEIVHDLAPGASLAFATAFNSEASFAQNILNLAAAGCNVIVDDVIYFDESPFEDGPVAQAVNAVNASGVLYFSSAGNEGNKDQQTSGTWEGDFLGNGVLPSLGRSAGTVHDFGDGGQSILIQAANGAPAALIWAEDYDLNTGNASTDFDLYLMDGALTTVLDASTDVQDGVGGDDFPVEIIDSTNSGERLVVARKAVGTTSSVPMFNLLVFRGRLDQTLATSGATRGHSAAAAAYSVAATPAAQSYDGSPPPGPYPGLFNSSNITEKFSSDGPRRVLLDSDGNELTPGNRTSTGGVVRQKPDVTAADGVSCAAPGFDPFYGTSAAAPHAAAIATLLESAVPSLTPAAVRTALTSSAIDIEAPGVDRDTGAGIVMAHAALTAAGAVAQARLDGGAPGLSEIVGDGDSSVEADETWSLSVPLTNTGGAAATGINGVLTTSTPGVTILSNSTAYPDLAAGTSAPGGSPFAFEVGDGLACGEPIHFTLTASFAGGESPASYSFTVPTAAPGSPVTFSYTGPAVAIPDGIDDSGTAPGAPAFANLSVSGLGSGIEKVELRIDGALCNTTAGSTSVGIDHSYVSDLRITLRSPSGTAVEVIHNTGGSGNNFCQTLLDDESSGENIESVVETQAPFSGSFLPNAALAAFNGEPADGTWQLEAQDFFQQDTGHIRSFSLIITPAVCGPRPLMPVSLGVDAHAAAGDASNHNGVLEAGETVQVAPLWSDAWWGSGVTGTASALTGPAGPTYATVDSSADYGAPAVGTSTDCQSATADCYLLTVAGTRPAPHWDATFVETLSAGPSKVWKVHVGGSFSDVPSTDPFYFFIEDLFHNGVTGGCADGVYCRDMAVTRAQMAVFLLKAKHGFAYVPPSCAGAFSDVACPSAFADWIEELAAEGVTAGCGGGLYCPGSPVSRRQMAVFLLKAKEGSSYAPPSATGIFEDVEQTDPFAPWIEDLYGRQITGGCSTSPLLYCPDQANTRGQMAVFVVKTFNLLLYGP